MRRLLDVVGDNTPLQDAFLLADDVLRQARLIYVVCCVVQLLFTT